VVTLLVQAVVLVLAGVAFGMRAPPGGVLIGLGFIAVVAISLSACACGSPAARSSARTPDRADLGRAAGR